MTFCGNCGTQIQEGIKFCPSCGQMVGGAPTQPAPPPTPVSAAPEPQVYTPPVMPGAPMQADIQDAQENKAMAVLAYILFFIPLLTGAHKTSAFAKFHTNQGTVMAIASITWSIAYGILSAILVFIPYIGWLLMMIIGLTGFVLPILCIVGIVNAVNGQMKPLPLVGGFTIIK